MRHIKSFIFIGIIFLLGYILYFIINLDLIDRSTLSYDFNDEKIVHSAIDSISKLKSLPDTLKQIIPTYSTQVEDFEAKVEKSTAGINFQIFKRRHAKQKF